MSQEMSSSFSVWRGEAAALPAWYQAEEEGSSGNNVHIIVTVSHVICDIYMYMYMYM